jgi:TetR/AcrR family transcriptional regulator, repressor for uid operon
MNFDSNHSEPASEPVATAPERGVRAEKREAQLARILEASRTCFVRSGFRGASMHDICREAEMSPGALYRYFPSKEAIIEAIAENDRQGDLASLAQISGNGDLIDSFISGMMAHFASVHSRGFAPLFTEIRAESMRNETVKNCCEKNKGEFSSFFKGFLDYAKSTGQIDPIVDNAAIVSMFMATGEGIIMGSLFDEDVSVANIEAMLRAMTVALLRPTQIKHGASLTQNSI